MDIKVFVNKLFFNNEPFKHAIHEESDYELSDSKRVNKMIDMVYDIKQRLLTLFENVISINKKITSLNKSYQYLDDLYNRKVIFKYFDIIKVEYGKFKNICNDIDKLIKITVEEYINTIKLIDEKIIHKYNKLTYDDKINFKEFIEQFDLKDISNQAINLKPLIESKYRMSVNYFDNLFIKTN